MLKNILLCLANAITAYLLSVTLISSAAIAAELVSAKPQVSFKPQISAHIRTLAASCASCHGTNGNSVLSKSIDSNSIAIYNAISNSPDLLHNLAGIDPSYFASQMLAFKSGARKATVMHHHAKGLNDDEINLLAVYFSQQKQGLSISPKSQLLKADHD